MKKLLLSIIVFSIAGVIIVSGEQIAVKILDSKVTELKNNYDVIKNENIELKNKITSILAIEKLYKIAETNKYSMPKETDIIHLQND